MKIIKETIKKVVNQLGWEIPEFSVEHPKDENHGDYSSNIAMIIWGTLKVRPSLRKDLTFESPRELAEEIVKQLTANSLRLTEIAKVEVAGAGFINFYLKGEFFLQEAEKAMQIGYGKNERLKEKRVMVEYTDPNPFKEFHIGHLMSNTIGESLARILEANGAIVKRANYQGDVGLHVAKSVWGMKTKFQITNSQILQWEQKKLNERQKMMGEAYAYGAKKYEEDEGAKAEIIELNKKIYQQSDAEVNAIYQKGREWSLEYFETIYQRLGTKFDEYFFESEAGPMGLGVVEEGIKAGVLEIADEGAVVYKGERDGLHTRVFRNKLGLPTYEAKDLGLAKTKYGRYKYDLSYIVTANEITEYFKVVLRVMEQLYPDLRAKTTHLPHGMMKLMSGKMSSRTGVVVTGEALLNELKEVVLAKIGERDIKEKDKVADMIGIGALKYTILKQGIGRDIVYDPAKMTNLEGDTGPYLQYTYARARSVLRKSQITNSLMPKLGIVDVDDKEMGIVRWIARYPEVVERAGVEYSPQLVANYIYELAIRFNSFYNGNKIGDNEGRLALTLSVANVIESGLGLLGIQAPEEM